MAQQAVPSAAVISLLGEEAPINGHAARISQDGLDHTPQEQSEEDMEDNEEDNVGLGMKSDHVLEGEDIVVEEDEEDDPDEVSVDELGTADFSVTHQLLSNDYNLKFRTNSILS